MKTLLIPTMLLLTVFSNAQENSDFKTFFNEFRKAAVEKDTEKLKTLIYPFKDEVEDMQEGLIQEVLSGNEFKEGDGAFSLKALDVLVKNHLGKIQKCDKEIYSYLKQDPIFGKTIRSIGRKHIYTFMYKDAAMILFKTDEKTQLFFWENLNNLLWQNNPNEK